MGPIGLSVPLGAAFGLDSVLTRTVLSVLVTAFILWFCLKDKSFRTSALHLGVGGVLALGCTIRQGITGVSTLSLGSLLALTAIVSGGLLGISRLGLDTANEGLG